jgi:hypothetical protein
MFFSISYLAAIDGQMKCRTYHPKAVKLARLAELRIELQFLSHLCWFECYCNSKVIALQKENQQNEVYLAYQFSSPPSTA